MNVFFQAAGGVLIASVLVLTLSGQGKEFAILISIAVCCVVLVLSVEFIEPILDLLCRIRELGQLNSQMLEVLFKILGIGMVSEIVALICKDAGNVSLGKALQMLGTAVILWLSIPVFEALLELIQEILGEL